MFLHAQGPEETSDSTPLNNETMMTTQSPAESEVISSENPNVVSTAESTAYPATDLTAENNVTFTPSQLTSTPETQPVKTTITEENPTSTEPPQVQTTTVTPEVTTTQPRVTTVPPDPQTTTEHADTTEVVVFTTMAEHQKTSSPEPTSTPTTTETTTSEATTELTTHAEETMETTHSTMATNSIPTTQDEGGDLSSTTDAEISTEPATITETEINDFGASGTGVQNSEESSSKWLVITIIVVIGICMLTGFCIIVFVKRRKKSGQQNFGHMNGRKQRSKKKKGENDAWAGPVNLEGGQNADCEDPFEAGQGDDRNPDGTDAVLSTFAALEANGGVGRPGSMEVQKWEEQEPLLFIDEDQKGEGKDKQKEEAEKAKGEQKGEEEDASKNMEMKEPVLNGGESFCLTTAV